MNQQALASQSEEASERLKIASGALPRGGQYLIWPVGGLCDDAVGLVASSLVVIETRTKHCCAFSYEGQPNWFGLAELERLGQIVPHNLRKHDRFKLQYFGSGRFRLQASRYRHSEARLVGTFQFVDSPVLDPASIADGLGGKESSLVIAAHLRFICALHPEALSKTRACLDETCNTFNYFIGHSDQVGLYRRQAAAVAPALALMCAVATDPPMLLVRAIDAGQPLVEAAAFECDVAPSVIRRLNQASLPELGTFPESKGLQVWTDGGRRFLLTLAAVPLSAWPGSTAQWEAAYDLYLRTRASWSSCPVLGEKIMLAGSRRRWHDLERWIARIDENGGIFKCSQFLGTYAELIRRRLAEHTQCSAATNTGHTIIARMARAAALSRLIRWSKQWHREYVRCIGHGLSTLKILAAARKPRSPFRIPKRIDDLRVVFLNDYAQFVREGAKLMNCLASLYATSLFEPRYFYSIRDVRGRPLSTLELLVSFTERKLAAEIADHRGKNNNPPPRNCECVAAQVLEHAALQLENGEFTKALSSRRAHPATQITRDLLNRVEEEAGERALELMFADAKSRLSGAVTVLDKYVGGRHESTGEARGSI